jgi:hypothetical protein
LTSAASDPWLEFSFKYLPKPNRPCWVLAGS